MDPADRRTVRPGRRQGVERARVLRVVPGADAPARRLVWRPAAPGIRKTPSAQRPPDRPAVGARWDLRLYCLSRSRVVGRIQLQVQPGARRAPVAIDGSDRYFHRSSGFLDAQPAEIA